MVTKKDVIGYLNKNKIAKRTDVAKHFKTYPNFISRLLKDEEILFDLNNKQDKHFSILPIIKNEFDANGLCVINGRVFSKLGKIKPTIVHLVYSSVKGLTIPELTKMLKTDNRIYLRELTKNGLISRARIKKLDIYLSTDESKRAEQIKNNKDEIIPDINIKKTIPVPEGIHLLEESDPVLRDLEIIRQIKSGKKKTEVAKQFNIVPETVANICKRFEQGQTKALIRKRKAEPYKITKSVESAIITEMVQNPNKTPEEITLSIKKIKDVSVKSVTNAMNKVKAFVKPKKNFLLEVRVSNK